MYMKFKLTFSRWVDAAKVFLLVALCNLWSISSDSWNWILNFDIVLHSKWSFNSYLDRIFAIFWPPPPPTAPPWLDSGGWTKTDIFDPLPPHLVHRVIEWPLTLFCLLYWLYFTHVCFLWPPPTSLYFLSKGLVTCIHMLTKASAIFCYFPHRWKRESRSKGQLISN